MFVRQVGDRPYTPGMYGGYADRIDIDSFRGTMRAEIIKDEYDAYHDCVVQIAKTIELTDTTKAEIEQVCRLAFPEWVCWQVWMPNDSFF